MNQTARGFQPAGAISRSLTPIDITLCLLPVGFFLSILSLV